VDALAVRKRTIFIGVKIPSIALLIIKQKMRLNKVNSMHKYLKLETDVAKNV
jgi:hypothetical protein